MKITVRAYNKMSLYMCTYMYVPRDISQLDVIEDINSKLYVFQII